MRLILAAIAVAFLGAAPGFALAQGKPAESTQAPKDQPKVMKTSPMPEGPPPELKKLEILLGSWTSNDHMFESPFGPESNSTGKTTCKWVFNGMHLEGNHEFEMAGKPMYGRSTWGWDPERKQYQIVWVDGTAPSAIVYNGAFSSDNTLVFYSTYMWQGKAVSEKLTYTFPDPDSYVFTMDSDMSGEMKRMMEQTGTRAKGAGAKTASKGAPAK